MRPPQARSEKGVSHPATKRAGNQLLVKLSDLRHAAELERLKEGEPTRRHGGIGRLTDKRDLQIRRREG
jgi:hypothetical protein